MGKQLHAADHTLGSGDEMVKAESKQQTTHLRLGLAARRATVSPENLNYKTCYPKPGNLF